MQCCCCWWWCEYFFFGCCYCILSDFSVVFIPLKWKIVVYSCMWKKFIFFYFCNKLLVTWIYNKIKKLEQFFIHPGSVYSKIKKIKAKKEQNQKKIFHLFKHWLLPKSTWTWYDVYATHTRHNEIMMMMVLYATAIFPCMFVGDGWGRCAIISWTKWTPIVHLTVHYACIQLKRWQFKFCN